MRNNVTLTKDDAFNKSKYKAKKLYNNQFEKLIRRAGDRMMNG